MTASQIRTYPLKLGLALVACALLASGCDVDRLSEGMRGLMPAAANSGARDGESVQEARKVREIEGIETDTTTAPDVEADGSALSSPDTQEDSPTESPETHLDSGTLTAPTVDEQYGPQKSYLPAYDIDVPVGRLSQSLIDTHAPGTRFRLAAGTHRLHRTLQPRQRQQFLGAPGAIISGSRVLTDWTRSGSTWYVSGQTQRLPPIPVGGVVSDCSPAYPRCARGENVFFDGHLLTHVVSLDQVGPGRYFFDYTRDRIYIGDDPSGHVVEATVAAQALASNAPGVVVRNLVIEMFGHGHAGAVNGGGSPGWSLINSEIRHNHGVGAKISSGSVMGNKVHHNGWFGLAGSGEGNRVVGNEISFNNTIAGFVGGGGGSKWVHNDGLIVRDNWSHHNGGPGLWTDINNINTLYENNRLNDNGQAGIMHEVSYRATIRNNTIRRNGFVLGSKWWVAGAGVYVINSPDVEVYDNIIADNRSGVMGRHSSARATNEGGTHGPTELRNFAVHDNTIRMSVGRTGIVSDSTDTFSNDGNRFLANSYIVDHVSGDYWEWDRNWGGSDGSGRTWPEWRKYGHDLQGGLAGS